jgi:hypothetical protein
MIQSRGYYNSGPRSDPKMVELPQRTPGASSMRAESPSRGCTVASRRRVLLAALGVAGVASGAVVARSHGQETTPAADDEISLLAVQACERGRTEPTANGGDGFSVVLVQPVGHTVFFSDRPARIAGLVETADFLADPAVFTGVPPNAALAFQADEADRTMRIATLELVSGSIADDRRTVTYQATMLPIATADLDDADDRLEAVERLPEAFGQAWLFIDAYRYGDIKPVNSDIVIN